MLISYFEKAASVSSFQKFGSCIGDVHKEVYAVKMFYD